MLLSDLLVIFGPQLTRGGLEELQELVYQAEASLQSQLAGFLVDRVFNHTEGGSAGDGWAGPWGRKASCGVGSCGDSLIPPVPALRH